MNNINSINSINNCYYPVFKPKQEINTTAKKLPTNISMNGLDTTANYNIANINKRNNTPQYIEQTLEEHLASLKNKQKLNKINYNLETNGPDHHWLELKDNNGNITDRIEYIDGKFVGCQINTYKNGKLIKCIDRNKNRIERSETFFSNDTHPQEKFTTSGINYKTTPNEFINYLDSNNTKYKIEYTGEKDNNRSVTLNEYDQNGKIIRNYWWYYGENKFNEDASWVSVSKLNNNEEETQRIIFDNEKTEVCDYNSLTKTKNYNNSELDVKTLTKSRITYNTKPKDYIEYLKSNNIKYEIKEFPELTKDIQIDTMDSNGNITTSLAWIHEENNNNLERICMQEISASGRKRFDFYPSETHTMTTRYIN